MAIILASKGCPQCGAPLEESVGFTGKCTHCGANVGHNKAECPCDTCQDYRDAQMGLELLDKMKRMKASRIAAGIEPPETAKNTAEIGAVRTNKTTTYLGCHKCNSMVEWREGTKYCPHCGTELIKSKESQPASIQMKICKRCHTANQVEAKFCKTCGTEQ